MKNFLKAFLPALVVFTAGYAFAQAAPPPLAPTDFLQQVVDFVKSIGGLSTLGIVSGVIVLLVASMKVSFLNDLIWSKLGSAQIWIGPVFGLLAGVLSQGSALTWASAFAYVSAGAGATFLHEILDLIKVIPGIGPMWVSIITVIESVLGGPAAQAQVQAKK